MLHHPDGSVLVVEFKELAVNPHFDPDQFARTLPGGKELIELNRPGRLEQVVQAWPEVESLLPVVLPEMALAKTGLLDYDLFAYVLRFQGNAEHDFLDIYYTANPGQFYFFRESKVGLLAGGCVEIDPGAWNVFERYPGSRRTARWVTAEREFFLVTSRDAGYLQSLLEQWFREEIQFKTIPEMAELGFEPVYEKEGH